MFDGFHIFLASQCFSHHCHRSSSHNQTDYAAPARKSHCLFGNRADDDDKLINQQIGQRSESTQQERTAVEVAHLNPFYPEAQVGTGADGLSPLHVTWLGHRMLRVLLSCGRKRIHLNHLLVHVLTQLWLLTGFSQLLLQVRPAKTSQPNKTVRTPLESETIPPPCISPPSSSMGSQSTL